MKYYFFFEKKYFTYFFLIFLSTPNFLFFLFLEKFHRKNKVLKLTHHPPSRTKKKKINKNIEFSLFRSCEANFLYVSKIFYFLHFFF